MTAACVYSPFLFASPAIELGNRMWRKRILPVGDVEYQGRTLHFTRQYLADLASAFNDRAYDQVPFQLADSSNTHTNDPERTAGQITGLELAADGLYATLAPTERGERLLSQNPGLGVSARIVEGYARSDGAFYPAAIQHVLGTLDPRIPGLGAWQPVDMSNGPTVVIDLSSSSWAGEPGPATQPASVFELSPAEQAELDQALAEVAADERAAQEDASAAFDVAFTDHAAQERARYEAHLEDLTAGRLSTENRLARAVARIGQGIYDTPPALAFTQPDQAAIELAADRAAITGREACGAPDDFGRCSSRFHALSCDHGIASADTYTEVAQAGAYERALGNFGTGAALSNADPDQIPASTIELAHELAALSGLGSGQGWEDMFSGPARPDLQQRLAYEIGEAEFPDRPGEPGPDVSVLARGLGLR